MAGISGMRCKGLHTSLGPMGRSSSLTFPTIHNCTLRNLRVPLGANPSPSSWITNALDTSFRVRRVFLLLGIKTLLLSFLHMIPCPSGLRGRAATSLFSSSNLLGISIVRKQQRKASCRDFHLTTIR